MVLEYTPVNSIPEIVAASHASFRTNRTQDLEFRREQLIALRRLIAENLDELAGAITTDLGRPKDLEVPSCIKACDAFINNLESMTANKKGDGSATDDCFVRYSPLGVVLIIGAWNFPITLVLQPIMGAIAAGNVCVVKPSEVSEASASVLTQLLVKYMDPRILSVVNGGVQETTVLLDQRFDHIFYTGNPQVGKAIMAAASKNLTPVTLELGGKCPAIITDDTNLLEAAQKVAAWKATNCGQICITVDYVLCPKHLQERFIQVVIGTWKHMFGEDIKNSERYPRIVNKRHFGRIEKILDASKKQNTLVFGGHTDVSKLYIEPTIFTNVSLSDEVMKDELFAPILPIVTSNSIEESISIINKNEHPLGLYLFSNNKDHIEKVLRETRSGAVVVNDVAAHFGNHSLPFGGVGNSGMGSYHGAYSIETFSHKRAVLIRAQANL
ncbi:Aldehyde dehydrogenase, dimeric NADP-preferring [Entomortierella beljakovae]|nr:Aldehyde dehydrogenase, dimeric NADP-preferring [Entomortierella beljakovae]